MSFQSIDPMHCDSLAFLVESIAGKILLQHDAQICLELDIDVKLGVPAEIHVVSNLIESLIEQSLNEMPSGGDLYVAAVPDHQGGIELEIADTGCDIASRPQSRPMAAAAIDAKLHWQNCPQGGACVTITFPPIADSNAGISRKAA